MSAARVLAMPPLVLPTVWAFAEGQKKPVRSAFSPAEMRVLSPALAAVQRPAAAFEAPKVQLAFYRKYTEGMLRRYVKMSLEAGRTPSLLGRELFRAKVTSYRVHSFEDVVIFVHDVEKCLAMLDQRQGDLIARIAMQEYSQGEAADLMGLSLRTVNGQYSQALDFLTQIFLDRKLMDPLKSCQGGRAGGKPVSTVVPVA